MSGWYMTIARKTQKGRYNLAGHRTVDPDIYRPFSYSNTILLAKLEFVYTTTFTKSNIFSTSPYTVINSTTVTYPLEAYLKI